MTRLAGHGPLEPDPAMTASPSPMVPDHGGDVHHGARALGKRGSDMVDFSPNINLFGFPPGVTGAVLTALAQVVR